MMELWLVIAGGLIGILAGPVTEWAKDHFERKRERELQTRNFQREHLLALSRHLVDGNVAAILFLSDTWENRFPKSGVNQNCLTFQENCIRAGSHATFVGNRQIRGLTQELLRATAAAMPIKDETALEGERAEIMRLFSEATLRIGETVRKL